jgi:2-dehydropantoate 2-reductase
LREGEKTLSLLDEARGATMPPSERIAFMGGGAIGSYLGAYLTRAGYNPVLIDPWPANVEAMRGTGIEVTDAQGSFTVTVDALHLCEVQAVRQPFDIVFIAMKSYDTAWAATFMQGYLAPTGCMVSAQNGLNDETIARIAGYERTLGCTISSITVALEGPGRVVRGGRSGRDRGYDIFRVGELNGVLSPRAERIAAMLDHVDAARATTNMWGERWAKLATNSMGNSLTAMSGLGAEGLADAAPRFPVLRDQVAREVVSVARALGVNVEPIGGRPAAAWLADDASLAAASPPASSASRPAPPDGSGGWRASTSQDIAKGRRTEIDHLNGYVSTRGREVGVPTPVNDAIVTVLKEVEAGVRAPSPANVDRVWDLVHEAVRV